MKKFLDGIGHGKMTKKINLIVLGSIAKLFVGELIEEAREIVERTHPGYDQPLLPGHVRAAARSLQKKKLMQPSVDYKQRLFKR